MASRGSRDQAGIPPDIKKLSFEDALEALEEIVQRLEGGEVSLEESIDIYSRGTHLKTHCEQKLQSAREKVERIVPGDLDGVGAEPAEID